MDELGLETAETEAFSSIFVARQPIFDLSDSIWGYELLFRDNPDSSGAHVSDPDLATAGVIADGFVVASEAVDPQHRLLINFPSTLLLNGTAQVLPPDRCMLEILEDVEPSPALLAELARLKQAGYRLAVDDYVGQAIAQPLLEFADVVKIDVLGMHPEDLAELVQSLHGLPAQLLAEKVEDAPTRAMCKDLGFSLFQGYFFAQPQLVSGRKPAAGQLTRLTLMRNLLGNPEAESLISLINVDPGLTYRLLRYINSSWFSLIQNVTSVHQTVHLLGKYTVQRWLTTVLMADMGSGTHSRVLAQTAVARGRFLEQMRARKAFCQQPPEALFLLGLLSCLDAQMGIPMREILSSLPLDPAIVGVLSGEDRSSPAGRAFELVLRAERGVWDEALALLQTLGIPPALAASGFNEAQLWARQISAPPAREKPAPKPAPPASSTN